MLEAMLVYPNQQQYSAPYPGMPNTVPVPGPSSYPPQFSYAMPQNWGQMNTSSSWAASAIGNVPTMASTAGMVAGFGTMFSSSPALRAASFLDPTTGAFEAGTARWAAMRAGGAGIGESLGGAAMAGAGPLALGLAALAATRYAGQQFMTGVREQQQLNAQLSGIGFANPMSMTGRGFGFQQTRQIGEMMREVDRADPFTTMRDLNHLMDQFTGMGMHRGIEDAREFGRKFKEFSETARDMAKMLGTTIEEAGRTFGAMRQAGYYTSADVMGNTLKMGLARGLGMNQDTFQQMQQTGAAVARQQQLTGKAGSQVATDISASFMLGAASKSSGGLGLFTDEQLMDITGASTGAEASASMGTRFSGAIGQFLTSTPAGRGYLAALGEVKGGRFTGGIDRDQLAKLAGGKIGLADLAGAGQSRLVSPQSRASFATGSQDIASSLLSSSEGTEAVVKVMQETARTHYRGQVESEDALKLLLEKEMGFDKREADAFAKMLGDMDRAKALQIRKMREEQGAEQLQLEMKRDYTFAGWKQKISGGLSDLFAPVKQGGAGALAWGQTKAQGAFSAVAGIDRAPITDTSTRASVMRLTSGGGAAEAASDLSILDVDREHAAGSTALSYMALKVGVKEAADLQVKLAAGGDFDATSMFKADELAPLESFLKTPEGMEAQSAVKLAESARMIGDEKEVKRQLNKARRLIERGIPSVFGEQAILDGRGEPMGGGATERYLTVVAQRAGSRSISKEVAGKGTVRSHVYGDVKKSRKEAVEALKSIGVKSDLAEQFAGGGTGAELMIRIAQTPESFGYIEKAKDRLKSQLDGASGDAEKQRQILAEFMSKDLGGNFSSADVGDVMRASIQVRNDMEEKQKSIWYSGVTPEQYVRGLRTAGGKLQTSIDTRVAQTEMASAARTLSGSFSAEEQGKLGEVYSRALSGVQAAAAGKGTHEALSDLGTLLTRAGTAGVGDDEIRRLAVQQQKAFGLADQLNAKEIASLYQVSEADIRKSIGAPETGGLSASQLRKAVQNLSGQDLLLSLGSGETGGIVRRNAAVDQQLVLNMTKLAETVNEGAETQRAIYEEVTGQSSPIKTPAEGGRR